MKKILKKNKWKWYLNLLAFLFCLAVYSQSDDALAKLPSIVPPTPDVAALGKFGEYSVGNNYGTVPVSIPRTSPFYKKTMTINTYLQ